MGFDRAPVTAINLAFDPFNRYYAPPSVLTTTQDGKYRFHWDTTAPTIVNPDAGNPFGCPTLRGTGTARIGRKLWLSEMGVAVGDTLSFAILAKVATGRSVTATIAWRNSLEVSLGTASSAVAVGNDGNHLLIIAAQVVPANCISIDLFIANSSGSGTVDCYAWYCVRGASLPATMVAEGVSDGQRALAQLQQITQGGDRGAGSMLQTRLMNLAIDPFFMRYGPTARYQDDRLRWRLPASLTSVKGDPTNPFGTNTVRTATNAGMLYTLADLGLSVGEVISLGLLFKLPATSSIRVSYAFRNSGGGVTGNGTNPTTTAGTGAPQFLGVENLTIPADTVTVEIYPTYYVGSDTIDFYGVYIIRGPAISGTAALADAYAQKFEKSWYERREIVPDIIGVGALQSWHRAQAGLALAEAGQVARIVAIGDSITNYTARWMNPFQSRICADVGGGCAGAGYVSLHPTSAVSFASWQKLTSVTQAGTWTNRDQTTTPVGKGPDLYDVTSGAVGATETIVATATQFKIYYLKQSGGGTFKYRIDGGAWSSNIDTANASDLFAVETISGLSSASHTLEIYANGATVTLFGVECEDTGVTNGTIVSKIAYSGASTATYIARSSGAVWRDAIAQMAPDMVIVYLGANDGSVVTATYKANLLTLLADIRAASGLGAVDVLLVAPYEHSTAHNYEFVSHADRLREIAREFGCAVVDLRQWINYRTTDPQGLFMDTTHINSYGGAIAAAAIFRALKW